MAKRGKIKEESSRITFREQLFGTAQVDQERDDVQRINVMTRLRLDVVDTLDALVELGAFNSRSEAVAVYLENAILSKKELYDKLQERAKEVDRMRDSAMELAIETIQSDKD